MTSEVETKIVDHVRPEGVYVYYVPLYPLVFQVQRVNGDCTVDSMLIAESEARELVDILSAVLSCPDMDKWKRPTEGTKYTIGFDPGVEELNPGRCKVCGTPNCTRETHKELSKRMRS